jgi:hypothetical protein
MLVQQAGKDKGGDATRWIFILSFVRFEENPAPVPAGPHISIPRFF